jgi:hypothetical protein
VHVTTLTQAQVSKETHKGTTGRFKRWEWGKQIKEGNPAFAWGRFITPLYGIKVVGFLAGMTYSVRPPPDYLHCRSGPFPLPVVRHSLSQCSLV